MRVITLHPVTSGLDMFDYTTDTQTEVSEAISETFDSSDCNSVTILNTYGISANLSVVDDDTSTEYYNETVFLIRDSIKDWWDYFFAPCRTGRDVVFYFEARTNSTSTITISYPGGTAKCGFCGPGVAKECGRVQRGVTVEGTDYSIVDVNDFGVAFLSVGAWAKRVDGDVFIESSELDKVHQKLIENRGKAAVFDFNEYSVTIDSGHTSLEGYQCLIAYGYTERFTPSIDNLEGNEFGLSVQGMI